MAGQEVEAARMAVFSVVHLGHEGQISDIGYRYVAHQKQTGSAVPVTAPSGWGMGSGKGLQMRI